MFDGNVEQGMYQQTRNGVPTESGKYSLVFPKGGNSEGHIMYQVPNKAEMYDQSFRLDGNNKRLILSERKPVTVALANGSTYEYIRQ